MADPHNKYVKFLKKGGRVLRIDKLNNKYQILTKDDLDYDSVGLPWLKYGFNDLILLKEDKVSAIEMLELIFKQQQKITVFNVQDILNCISKKHEVDIRPLTCHNEFKDEVYDIDDPESHQLDFKLVTEGTDGRRHTLDSNLFTDNGEEFILNVYPTFRLIGPYKSEDLYDEVHKAITNSLSEDGLLCFTAGVDEVRDFISK